MNRTERWKARLAELCDRYLLPGAALAVDDGDEVVEVAAGVVNVATGVETTPDTLFQIGSITKVYTTTLMMQTTYKVRDSTRGWTCFRIGTTGNEVAASFDTSF